MTPTQSKTLHNLKNLHHLKKPPPSKKTSTIYKKKPQHPKKHQQRKNLLTLTSPVATPHCLTIWSWHHPILLPGVLRVARSIGILVRRWGPSDNHRGWFRINGRDTPLAFAGLSSSSWELIKSWLHPLFQDQGIWTCSAKNKHGVSQTKCNLLAQVKSYF